MAKLAITLCPLRPGELGAASRLAATAMCDNPIHVHAFGTLGREGRCAALERFFATVLGSLLRRGAVVGAYEDGVLTGLCGMAPPGQCQPGVLEKLALLPAVTRGTPPGTAWRFFQWSTAWARRDPAAAHWHLGPVAVDPLRQGRGIGGALLGDFCARMDRYGTLAYLETDKADNVAFYQKFGFTVKSEKTVIGVQTWFMKRRV